MCAGAPHLHMGSVSSEFPHQANIRAEGRLQQVPVGRDGRGWVGCKRHSAAWRQAALDDGQQRRQGIQPKLLLVTAKHSNHKRTTSGKEGIW